MSFFKIQNKWKSIHIPVYVESNVKDVLSYGKFKSRIYAVWCSKMILRTCWSHYSHPHWWSTLLSLDIHLVLCSQISLRIKIKQNTRNLFKKIHCKIYKGQWINNLLKFSNRKSKYLLRHKMVPFIRCWKQHTHCVSWFLKLPGSSELHWLLE